MRLGNDTDTSVCSIDQESTHRDLGPRMEVNLGLLDIDELSGTSGLEGDYDRKCLGDAKTHIGDTDQVMGTAALGTRQPAHTKFNLSIIQRFGFDLPCEAQQVQVVS